MYRHLFDSRRYSWSFNSLLHRDRIDGRLVVNKKYNNTDKRRFTGTGDLVPYELTRTNPRDETQPNAKADVLGQRPQLACRWGRRDAYRVVNGRPLAHTPRASASIEAPSTTQLPYWSIIDARATMNVRYFLRMRTRAGEKGRGSTLAQYIFNFYILIPLNHVKSVDNLYWCKKKKWEIYFQIVERECSTVTNEKFSYTLSLSLFNWMITWHEGKELLQ